MMLHLTITLLHACPWLDVTLWPLTVTVPLNGQPATGTPPLCLCYFLQLSPFLQL